MNRILHSIAIVLFFIPAKSQVVINEIYGGGGNASAIYNRDVIQLKNLGNQTVNLTGYALQYASESGNSWNVDLFPSNTIIGAGEILNVMLGTNDVNVGADPPSPSVLIDPGAGGFINLAVRAGKIALTSNTTQLTGSGCPTSAVDYVGYGNTGTQTCGPHTTATLPAGAASNSRGYIRINTSVPGTFEINNSPLPVEFTEFNVRIEKSVILLSFSTLSEINNDYFTIERSADGFNYTDIGTIQGAGNSNELRNYDFEDYRPLSGMNYYRIRQTDFDGRYGFSDVRAIRFNSNVAVSIAPLASSDEITVDTGLESFQILLFDTTGRLVKTSSGFYRTALTVSDLQQGIYYLHIKGDSYQGIHKIMRI